MTNVNIRVDEKLKDDFFELCESIGLSASSAFVIFMKKAVCEQAIPFELTANKQPPSCDKRSSKNSSFYKESDSVINDDNPLVLNGVLFDDRLEASWAAFFTTLGIAFDYHPAPPPVSDGSLASFKPTFKIKCYGRETYDKDYSYDLYVKVANIEDDTLDLQLDKICPSEPLSSGVPVLILGDIPNVKTEEDVFDSEVMKCFDSVNPGVSHYCAFNYHTINGRKQAAFPGVNNGRFFLYDQYHFNDFGRRDAVVMAFKNARTVRDSEGSSFHISIYNGFRFKNKKK